MIDRILACISIFIGIVSTFLFICFFTVESETFGIFSMWGGIASSIIGIAYSLVVRKKCFPYEAPLWIAGFALNILVLIGYIVIIGMVFIIFVLPFLIGFNFG